MTAAIRLLSTSLLTVMLMWPAILAANADITGAACVIPVSSVAKGLGPSVSGTVTAVVTQYDGAAGVVDATARLQWQGKERVYRTHLGTVSIGSEFQLACAVLAADPIDVETGLTLSQTIGVTPSQLKITTKSFTGLDFSPVPGTASTASGIAEITIYVQS